MSLTPSTRYGKRMKTPGFPGSMSCKQRVFQNYINLPKDFTDLEERTTTNYFQDTTMFTVQWLTNIEHTQTHTHIETPTRTVSGNLLHQPAHSDTM